MLPVMFEEWVIKLHHQNPGILLGGSTLHLDIVKKKKTYPVIVACARQIRTGRDTC
jgi:hypothetical protein